MLSARVSTIPTLCHGYAAMMVFALGRDLDDNQ